MKKLALLSLATLCAMALKASPLVTETPIRSVGTPTTVSVSTSVWTLIPAASSLPGRNGIIVNVPADLNANVGGILGSCTSIATSTNTVPIEFIKGEQSMVLPLSEDVCFWGVSLHTGAESVHVQEFKQ